MLYREWPLRIQDIIQAIGRIQRWTVGLAFEDFAKTNEIIQQGILYNFIIIGEAAINVPGQIQSRHPQIPWRLMSDMRNVIAPQYFQVELERLWRTIHEDLPSLVPLLQELLEREGRAD